MTKIEVPHFGEPDSCAKRLAGDVILQKVEELWDISKSDICLACGYYNYNSEGRISLCFTEMYEALLNANGIFLDAENLDKEPPKIEIINAADAFKEIDGKDDVSEIRERHFIINFFRRIIQCF